MGVVYDDLIFFKDPLNTPKLSQGVTTVVAGNCGSSPAPVREATLETLQSYIGILARDVDFKWRSYGGFLDALEDLGGLGTNVAGLVGHGTLRISVMGMQEKQPTEEEMKKMRGRAEQAMSEGAYGISTGLIYPPGTYAETQELIKLAEVIAEYNGVYATHMRNEGEELLKAVREASTIGKKAEIPVEISHHKAAGEANWGKTQDSLAMLKDARNEGIDVTADAYPYTAGASYLAATLPPWAHEGEETKLKERCRDPTVREKLKSEIKERTDWENLIKNAGWENIILTYSENFERFENKSIEAVAKAWKKGPFDTLFDIIAKDGTDAEMILFMMDETDVERVITHPYVMIGTDGIDTGAGTPHPRTYGTFPRVLGRYAREKEAITMENAVRKMTSLPAQKLGLQNRGVLKEGMYADIVIFDPATIRDEATYEHPRQEPTGIEHVLTNGTVIIRNGKVTKEKGGKVLRK